MISLVDTDENQSAYDADCDESNKDNSKLKLNFRGKSRSEMKTSHSSHKDENGTDGEDLFKMFITSAKSVDVLEENEDHRHKSESATITTSTEESSEDSFTEEELNAEIAELLEEKAARKRAFIERDSMGRIKRRKRKAEEKTLTVMRVGLDGKILSKETKDISNPSDIEINQSSKGKKTSSEETKELASPKYTALKSGRTRKPNKTNVKDSKSCRKDIKAEKPLTCVRLGVSKQVLPKETTVTSGLETLGKIKSIIPETEELKVSTKYFYSDSQIEDGQKQLKQNYKGRVKKEGPDALEEDTEESETKGVFVDPERSEMFLLPESLPKNMDRLLGVRGHNSWTEGI